MTTDTLTFFYHNAFFKVSSKRWLILFFLPLMTNLQAQDTPCQFVEQDGLVVIEAENLPLTRGWQVSNDTKGFSGAGYIFWNGQDHFEEPRHGLIEAKIRISNPGIYRFQWRGRVGEGADFTEYNDTWLRFPDASDYYGLKEGEKVYPKGSGKLPEPEGAGADGWFKIFHTADINWAFSTNTSDNEGYQPYVFFADPGVYTLQISGRSRKHFIDRLVLHQKNQSNATDLFLPVSGCLVNEQTASKEVTAGVQLTGQLQVWHKISLTFDGPEVAELANPNPFADYRLRVRFQHASGKGYTVPGFYAACGDAGNTSCNHGNKWRVHFAPDLSGTWSWEASFHQGNDAAISGAGKALKPIHGKKGKFEIIQSDKEGRDMRAPHKGRLQYVGAHYLRHSGTTPDLPNGSWFLKAGADAVENTLAYDEFDATPNRKSLRKSWGPHAADFDPLGASSYTWAGGKGRNILGMVHYLARQGMNAFSFLTFTLAGDDQNVFPHLLKVSVAEYDSLKPELQWDAGVHHDRFDCSKLDQWEQLFTYADLLGMYVHFKLGEEENETLMDSGKLGRERKLYYRELIARFGHHLAINWNIGEENGPPIQPHMTDLQRVSAIDFIAETDPYQNHLVVHSRPDLQDTIYAPLLGTSSKLTGASLQCVNNEVVHKDVRKWVSNSAKSGRKWVVTNDEQGSYKVGVAMDAKGDQAGVVDNRREVRAKVLWGTFMAGGAGVEYYYGYQTGCGDLDCQDHRTRETKWKDAKNALNFFNNYLQPYLPDLKCMDEITAASDDYVLGKEGEVYVVYLPDGGDTAIDLPAAEWQIQWYNPRAELSLLSEASTISANNLVAPSVNDWVALIKKKK